MAAFPVFPSIGVTAKLQPLLLEADKYYSLSKKVCRMDPDTAKAHADDCAWIVETVILFYYEKELMRQFALEVKFTSLHLHHGWATTQVQTFFLHLTGHFTQKHHFFSAASFNRHHQSPSSIAREARSNYYAELEEAKSEALSLNQKSSTNPRGQGLSPEGDETCTTFSPAARSVRTIVDVPVGDVSFTGSMGDTGDIGSGGEMGDVGDVGDVGSGGGEGSVGSAGSYFSVASVKGHPDEEAQAEQRQGRIGQCGVSVDADVDMGASAGGGVGARVQELLSQVQQLEEERQADRQSERQDWAY
ncbi:hypothetical protein B484DRAFT_434176 [Ochromonadaceae sp. CCMP2298]|nr:hypothetical protein B484DRAFT_434176 [Ochromonadaceae sp. CCMP2298]